MTPVDFTEALASARTHLIALSDGATSEDLSLIFECLLIALDALNGDVTPAAPPLASPLTSAEHHAAARRDLEAVSRFQTDPLATEILLALVDEAHPMDAD